MHEIKLNGRRVLLDCGMYQGHRKEAFQRNRDLPVDSRTVDAVFLSHAHLDHCGNLPNLVRNGFDGPIFTSPATADLCDAMLRDAAYIQEKDAEYLNRRADRRKKLMPELAEDARIEPLYTMADVERTLPLFRSFLPCCPLEAGGVRLEGYEAGHMLGSYSLVVQAEGVRLGFSGDIGRKGLPIIPDPSPIPPVDYLILESTYGNRLHEPVENTKSKLADIVRRTAARGGKIIMPAFAVGRTQQLVVLLNELNREGEIPNIPVFVDSPLAVNVTEVFRHHIYLYDEETQAFLRRGEDPFGFRRLHYVRDVEQSKALNDLRGPFVVISASGMCEAGRILHHLKNSIGNPRNTILITGFQAEHTLGRKIVERLPQVPIFGDVYDLRAEVDVINELSGHADQRELIEWMKPLVGRLKRVFLVHGELKQQVALKEAIESRYRLRVEIPKRGDRFELN
jgi:metallo-beta-lactamase family protein